TRCISRDRRRVHACRSTDTPPKTQEAAMSSLPVAIWTHLRRTPGGLLAALTVCAFALLAIFAPLIAPYNPLTPTPAFRSPPSPDHWFGTDPTGLDVFSRVIYGTRLDLVVGVMGTLVSIAVGLFLGLIVGYYQNALTSIFLRVIDLL